MEATIVNWGHIEKNMSNRLEEFIKTRVAGLRVRCKDVLQLPGSFISGAVKRGWRGFSPCWKPL